MKTLMKGQSVAVRYKDKDFDQFTLGLRQSSSAGQATLLAFTGMPKMQLQLAAKEVAASFKKPLQVVNLPSTSSKYIGETEKNLTKVFQRAKASGAVLLFDEADALFGTRTGVKDSHDRFANQETSYLLQKIEQHQGLVIGLFQSKVEAERKRSGLRQLVVRFPPGC